MAPPVLRGEPPEQLRSGDRLTRAEFHRLYEQTPEHFKAELIGGTVFVASPVSQPHATLTNLLNAMLGLYRIKTPGVEALDNGTVLLNDDSEPQPDVALRVRAEHGGLSRLTPDGKFVVGAPEMIVEVAHSSRAIDLHAKRADYARNGVREYLVWIVADGAFAWFDLSKDMELTVPDDGVLKSFEFPGLWLDGRALRADDPARLLTTLESGLATPEHAEFVKRLADAKR